MDQNILEQVTNMSQEDMNGFREFLKNQINSVRERITHDESLTPAINILQVMSNMPDDDLKKMIHVGAGFVNVLEGAGMKEILNILIPETPDGWILALWSEGRWISDYDRHGFTRADGYFENNRTMVPLRLNHQNTALGEIMNVDSIPATKGVKDIAMHTEGENVLVIDVVNMDLVN